MAYFRGAGGNCGDSGYRFHRHETCRSQTKEFRRANDGCGYRESGSEQVHGQRSKSRLIRPTRKRRTRGKSICRNRKTQKPEKSRWSGWTSTRGTPNKQRKTPNIIYKMPTKHRRWDQAITAGNWQAADKEATATGKFADWAAQGSRDASQAVNSAKAEIAKAGKDASQEAEKRLDAAVDAEQAAANLANQARLVANTAKNSLDNAKSRAEEAARKAKEARENLGLAPES